jgi:hypothetical protein
MLEAWVCGCCGAFWNLPFQLIIRLVRWVSEAAIDTADRMAIDMEYQAHHEDNERPAAGYTASLLTDIEQGNRLNPPYIPCLRSEDKEDT